MADQTAETAPAEGTIVFTALAADVVDSSTTDLLHRQPPKAVTLDEFGRFVFTAQDSDTSWKVQLLSAAKRTVWTRHWVPSPGLAQNVRDLVVVDPATLEPTAEPEAAWWAALAAAADPSVIESAVEDYLAANPPSGSPDATTTLKGVVQLAGDLSGAANAPTVPALAGLGTRIDALETAPGPDVTAADLTAHATDTTNVHGIADASALVVTTDPRLSDARLPTSHNHAVGDVTGLQGVLDAKSPTSHNHAVTDLNVGTVADGEMIVRSGAALVGAPVPAGGGSAMTLLADSGVHVGAAFTFAAIPQNYRTLRLEYVVIASSSGGRSQAMIFNGDSALNYATNGNAGGQASIPLLAAQAASSAGGGQRAWVEIPGYAETGTIKIASGISAGTTNGGNNNMALTLIGGAWVVKDAPITSLTIAKSAPDDSTRYRLYGVN